MGYTGASENHATVPGSESERRLEREKGGYKKETCSHQFYGKALLEEGRVGMRKGPRGRFREEDSEEVGWYGKEQTGTGTIPRVEEQEQSNEVRWTGRTAHKLEFP